MMRILVGLVRSKGKAWFWIVFCVCEFLCVCVCVSFRWFGCCFKAAFACIERKSHNFWLSTTFDLWQKFDMLFESITFTQIYRKIHGNRIEFSSFSIAYIQCVNLATNFSSNYNLCILIAYVKVDNGNLPLYDICVLKMCIKLSTNASLETKWFYFSIRNVYINI